MTSPEQLLFLQDIIRLPKPVLVTAASEMGLDAGGAAADLAMRVWEAGRGARGELIRFTSHAFVGKTTITWYPFSGGDSGRFFEAISLRLGYNVLQAMRVPPDDAIGSVPLVIGATRFGEGSRYLLRVVQRQKRYGQVSGLGDQLQTPLRLSSILIDFEHSFFEVRGELAQNPSSVRSFRLSLGEEIDESTPYRVLEPFGNSLEALATALDGDILDANSAPEAGLEALTQDQLETVVNALRAIDDYVSSEDEQQLLAALTEMSPHLSSLGSTSFSAIVLAGMARVRLSSGTDLRSLPLYKILAPNLQHLGGDIRFPWENGRATIRVGIQKNSIYFVSPATEALVDHVRAKVLPGQQRRGEHGQQVAS